MYGEYMCERRGVKDRSKGEDSEALQPFQQEHPHFTDFMCRYFKKVSVFKRGFYHH